MVALSLPSVYLPGPSPDPQPMAGFGKCPQGNISAASLTGLFWSSLSSLRFFWSIQSSLVPQPFDIFKMWFCVLVICLVLVFFYLFWAGLSLCSCALAFSSCCMWASHWGLAFNSYSSWTQYLQLVGFRVLGLGSCGTWARSCSTWA